MTTEQLAEALDRIAPVTLADLDATASLLVRRDRKYLVPVEDAVRLVEQLGEPIRVLCVDQLRSFRYESVYFDTPDFDLYLAAARRRPRRYKVRTRAYLDSGRCMLEMKTRDGRGRTVKQRIDYSVELRYVLNDDASWFVGTSPLVGGRLESLRPVLTTRYERSTLLLPGQARVTIDVRFQGIARDGRTVTLPDIAVLETKSRRAPSRADRWLWERGYRPLCVSKFGTSLAALEPWLPANKWARALRRPWRVAPEITDLKAS